MAVDNRRAAAQDAPCIAPRDDQGVEHLAVTLRIVGDQPVGVGQRIVERNPTGDGVAEALRRTLRPSAATNGRRIAGSANPPSLSNQVGTSRSSNVNCSPIPSPVACCSRPAYHSTASPSNVPAFGCNHDQSRVIRTLDAPRPAQQTEVFRESGAVEAGVGDDGARGSRGTGCESTARRCRCWRRVPAGHRVRPPRSGRGSRAARPVRGRWR